MGVTPVEDEEKELETEVDDLRKLIAAERAPMIEGVIEEDNPRVVLCSRRSRFGGKKTKKTQRNMGGMAVRTLMMKLATSTSKKELTEVSKRLPGLNEEDRENGEDGILATLDDGMENDLIEEQEKRPCG